ncbi:MAG: hypothetical protein M3R04_08055, partial [bacterium]|nr:hypothetical protein [bacterium]
MPIYPWLAYNLAGVELSLAELRARLEGRRRDLSRLRIIVLAGGGSSEREVSLRSGRAVLGALKALGYQAELLELGSDDLSISPRESGAQLSGGQSQQDSTLAQSADASTLPAIRRADVVFTMMHGSRGENGAWQGLLELADVAFVSAEVKGSALAMDKVISKRLFESLGVQTPRWWTHRRG